MEFVAAAAAAAIPRIFFLPDDVVFGDADDDHCEELIPIRYAQSKRRKQESDSRRPSLRLSFLPSSRGTDSVTYIPCWYSSYGSNNKNTLRIRTNEIMTAQQLAGVKS